MADASLAVSQFCLEYHGAAADRHLVDMRLAGRALAGFDRILSDGAIFLAEARVPRKREHAPLIFYTSPPIAGSSLFPGVIAPVAGMLPFGYEILVASGTDALGKWLNLVLGYFGGRRSVADQNLDALMRLAAMHHASEADWRRGLFRVMERLITPAKDLVGPIGSSASSARFRVGGADAFEADQATADAIRDRGEVDVGASETLIVRVDGFQHHNRILKIENPEDDGFISAIVTDPAFEASPNLYTEAAGLQALLSVTAKRTHRSGRLERIYISDASGIVDETA